MKLVSFLLCQLAQAKECSDKIIVNGIQWQINGMYDGVYVRDGEKNGHPKWTMFTGYYNNWNQETEIVWNPEDTRSLDIGVRFQHAKGWVVKSVRFDSEFYGPNYYGSFVRFWSNDQVDCPEDAIFRDTDGGYETAGLLVLEEPVVPPTAGPEQPDKFNYDREPRIRVNKLVHLFTEYVNANFGSHSRFQTAVGNRFASLGDRMIRHFDKKNPECNYWSEVHQSGTEESNERYDRTDPCKGAGQLTKSMSKWAGIYNANCKENSRRESFASKITRQMGLIKEKLKRKYSNNSANQCN